MGGEGRAVSESSIGKKAGRRPGTSKRALQSGYQDIVYGSFVVDRGMLGLPDARRGTVVVCNGSPDENHVRVAQNGFTHTGERVDLRDALGQRFWHKGQWRTPSKAQADPHCSLCGGGESVRWWCHFRHCREHNYTMVT